MSRSGGTGRPLWFRCWRCRKLKLRNPAGALQVSLTGRTKVLRDGMGRGRSTNVRREYRCDRGHVGWSRHVDLVAREGSPS